MILTAAYKELTAHAFSGRVKEIAAIAAAAKGHGNISADLGALFDGSRRLFNDDIAAIQSVLQGNAQTSVGIDKLQKVCLCAHQFSVIFLMTRLSLFFFVDSALM
jgi:hypothetical protein